MSIMPREAVVRFAEEMERVLKENDHKDGWDSLDAYELLGSIDDERDELLQAMDTYFEHKTPKNLAAMLDEVTDIANFCMMIFDNYREDYREIGKPKTAEEQREEFEAWLDDTYERGEEGAREREHET